MFDKKAMDYILDLSQTNPGNQTQNDITLNRDFTSQMDMLPNDKSQHDFDYFINRSYESQFSDS